MNSSQLLPAYQFAAQHGVKAVVYGAPGTGKTPLMNTAPRPTCCVVEPGFLSMLNSSLPTWGAVQYNRMVEWVDWATQSSDARQFDTFFLDSGSQAAQNIIAEERTKGHKDQRKMWYEAQLKLWGIMNRLYMAPTMHVVIICKEDSEGDTRKPLFPSKAMRADVSHLFDEIIRVEKMQNPQTGVPVTVFRCQQGPYINYDVRDRSMKLAEIEPANYTTLFAKAMGQSR